MTETIRAIEAPLPPKAVARIQQLAAWLAADEPTGDYTRTAKLWLAEVTSRITKRRPTILRMPRILANRFGLSYQRVLLTENGDVYAVTPGNIKGKLLFTA